MQTTTHREELTELLIRLEENGFVLREFQDEEESDSVTTIKDALDKVYAVEMSKLYFDLPSTPPEFPSRFWITLVPNEGNEAEVIDWIGPGLGVPEEYYKFSHTIDAFMQYLDDKRGYGS